MATAGLCRDTVHRTPSGMGADRADRGRGDAVAGLRRSGRRAWKQTFGRKRVFLNAVFNGITLGGLYFLVASGFTLIFGLMRNVNLAHGSLYLFGGYIGYAISTWTGSWLLGFIVAFIGGRAGRRGPAGRRLPPDGGQDLRQTMVTIGLSIVFADLMLWVFGGDFYQVQTPSWLVGPIAAAAASPRSNRPARPVYLHYPLVRLVIFVAAVVIGIAMWLALNRTRDRHDGARRRR